MGVLVRSDGCRDLGSALGQQDFCSAFMESRAEKWCEDLYTLARMAETQPQASYAVFTKGLSSKWKYHIHCTEHSPKILHNLDQIIDTAFLPAITGGGFDPSRPLRTLLTLPARLGGLAIPVLHETSLDEHRASLTVTQPLVEMIVGNEQC